MTSTFIILPVESNTFSVWFIYLLPVNSSKYCLVFLWIARSLNISERASNSALVYVSTMLPHLKHTFITFIFDMFPSYSYRPAGGFGGGGGFFIDGIYDPVIAPLGLIRLFQGAFLFEKNDVHSMYPSDCRRICIRIHLPNLVII